MMRVAYLLPRGDVGGAEIATIRFIEGHDRSKVTPFAFFMENGPAVDRVRALDVVADVAPILPRLSRPRELRQGRAWITERLRHHSIDLQHSVMAWTHALGGAAARRAGARVVWFQQNRPNTLNPMAPAVAKIPALLYYVLSSKVSQNKSENTRIRS